MHAEILVLRTRAEEREAEPGVAGCEKRHCPKERRGTPPRRRIVHTRDELLAWRPAERGERERADLLERLDRDADIRGNRLERSRRPCSIR